MSRKPTREPTRFSPEALAYRRRLVEAAPPLTSEQAAIIRTCAAHVHRQRHQAAAREHADRDAARPAA